MIRKLTILIFALTWLAGQAFATHIVGGEMTYRCLGRTPGSSNSKDYQVTLVIYQDGLTGDINAINQDNPAFIAIFVGNTNTKVEFLSGLGFRRNYDSIPDLNIGHQEVPPNFSNECVTNPPPTRLYRESFTKVFSLNDNKVGYKVVYQRCCRNNTIVNISNPGTIGATYSCFIPPTDSILPAICNNSAIFKNYPPQIICIKNPLVYDHSATDADGDSLSYRFCAAILGGDIQNVKPSSALSNTALSVNYLGIYSATNPMGGDPQIQIDPRTGLITGTPDMLGRFVVTVCCTEWRFGQRINETSREFQFVVTNCSKSVVANIPQFSDEPNTYIVQCKSKTVKFYNLSTGGFNYHWDFGVGDRQDDTSAEFDPTFTYPDTGSYLVSLVVNSGTTCPDSISRIVKVFPDFHADFSISGIPCPKTPIQFNDLSDGTYKPTVAWRWTFGDSSASVSTEQNPMHIYPRGGTYPVTLIATNVKGCKDTARRSYNVDKFIPYAGEDTAIVQREYILFNATGGNFYTWMPDIYLSNGNTSNPTGVYPDTGTFNYVVRIENLTGCVGYDTIQVRVVDGPLFIVPNAFTPNGDGLNDFLKPIAVGYRKINYFGIFNRWGQQVYLSDQFKVGWDGTFNGKPADMGTYFWQLKTENRFGQTEFFKGDITLLR